jgi:hypothetical protein
MPLRFARLDAGPPSCAAVLGAREQVPSSQRVERPQRQSRGWVRVGEPGVSTLCAVAVVDCPPSGSFAPEPFWVEHEGQQRQAAVGGAVDVKGQLARSRRHAKRPRPLPGRAYDAGHGTVGVDVHVARTTHRCANQAAACGRTPWTQAVHGCPALTDTEQQQRCPIFVLRHCGWGESRSCSSMCEPTPVSVGSP